MSSDRWGAPPTKLPSGPQLQHMSASQLQHMSRPNNQCAPPVQAARKDQRARARETQSKGTADLYFENSTYHELMGKLMDQQTHTQFVQHHLSHVHRLLQGKAVRSLSQSAPAPLSRRKEGPVGAQRSPASNNAAAY